MFVASGKVTTVINLEVTSKTEHSSSSQVAVMMSTCGCRDRSNTAAVTKAEKSLGLDVVCELEVVRAALRKPSIELVRGQFLVVNRSCMKSERVARGREAYQAMHRKEVQVMRQEMKC